MSQSRCGGRLSLISMARLRFRGRAIGLPHRLQPLPTELYMDTRIEPEDCMQAAIDAAGGNKIVGAKLRPEMNPNKAGKWPPRCSDPALQPERKSVVSRQSAAARVDLGGRC